jgi:AraC-like DNA-binding protein
MSTDRVLSIDQERLDAGDRVKFWRPPRVPGLECLRARFRKHAYAPHAHDTYVVGAIVSGVEAIRYRGTRLTAPAGSVVAINPDELHDGSPLGAGFAYRMFYAPPTLMRDLAGEIAGRASGLPAFVDGVIDDADLAARLARVHRLMEAEGAALNAEEGLVEVLSTVIRRHGKGSPGLRRPGDERTSVRRVRAYIDAHCTNDMSLDDLARLASLSRFHLIRAFRKQVGMTPHVYLTCRRVARAKALLRRRLSLVEVALDCGFFDQSHLSRVFKSHTGITPGQYRAASNIVQ